jgi:phage gp37-like protein
VHYTITEIEDALLSALAPLAAELGVRTLGSYQNELDSEAEIKRVSYLFPAVYVAYGGTTPSLQKGHKTETITYNVMVCDRNLRGEESARRGDAAHPGVYALLEGVRDKLYRQRLGLKIMPLTLVHQGPVYFGAGISVYNAEYETVAAL